MGGLGNQMFQYAAGRRLAYTLDTELKLDISWFEKQSLRSYDLGAFKIREKFATVGESVGLIYRKRWFLERILDRILRRTPQYAASYVKEKKSFHFDSDILNLPDNLYLDGYWQSEKHFLDIADIIIREFEVKKPPGGKVKELSKIIASCESVSLHIRRGDYIEKKIGCCDLNYYERCIDYLNQRVKNPHIFVFSDEPQWAYENLKMNHTHMIIGHNSGNKSYEDMWLMSLCKHHIVANSTFSWWGAWLNINPNKIVLCPINWIARQDHKPKDLFPDNWIKL